MLLTFKLFLYIILTRLNTMLVLNIDKLNKNFGYGNLFTDLSFSLNDGETLSIVGPNGSGKSTLLKVIAGLESPDSGNVNIRKGAKVAYLDQKSAIINDDRTVYEILLDVFDDLNKMNKQIQEYEDKLALVHPDDSNYNNILEKYCSLMEKFSSSGGYDIDMSIKTVIDGLSLSQEMLSQNYNTLSGGEKTLVQLASCLLKKPDLLLLDEPTNNLDIKRTEWLESFIKKYKGGIITVSHDRYFIDSTSSKILEIDAGKGKIFSTNYSGYIKEKEHDFEKNMALYKDQQDQIKHDIEMYRYFLNHNFPDKAKFFKEKYEKEIREAIPKPRKPQKINLNFDLNRKSSKIIIKTENLTITDFQRKSILNNVNTQVCANERIAILGDNGSGKSTYIKAVLGKQSLPVNGEIIVGPSVQIGYLPQIINYENENDSVLKTFEIQCGLGEEKSRSILFKFGFNQEDVNKLVKNISGGERVKLKLAELIQQGVNTLILDEPTNHIDIPTRESLENALSGFNGTLIFVSHDRYFINKFANKIFEFKDGNIKTYHGNYQFYLSERNKTNVQAKRNKKSSIENYDEERGL